MLHLQWRIVNLFLAIFWLSHSINNALLAYIILAVPSNQYNAVPSLMCMRTCICYHLRFPFKSLVYMYPIIMLVQCMKWGLLSWLRHQKGLVFQYQLHNRVENLADVSARCFGLLQANWFVSSSSPWRRPGPEWCFTKKYIQCIGLQFSCDSMMHYSCTISLIDTKFTPMRATPQGGKVHELITDNWMMHTAFATYTRLMTVMPHTYTHKHVHIHVYAHNTSSPTHMHTCTHAHTYIHTLTVGIWAVSNSGVPYMYWPIQCGSMAASPPNKTLGPIILTLINAK